LNKIVHTCFCKYSWAAGIKGVLILLFVTVLRKHVWNRSPGKNNLPEKNILRCLLSKKFKWTKKVDRFHNFVSRVYDDTEKRPLYQNV